MALRKRYQSMGGSPLSVLVQVGDRLVSCDFTGGMKFPVEKLPVYSTSDPLVQQALEENPGFELSYRLMDIIETESQQKVLEPISFPNLATAKAYLKVQWDLPVRNGHKKSDIEKMFAEQNLELRIETD